MGVRVASASETVACEREAIEQGTPASELMRRAGEAAADMIADRFAERARDGVSVVAGTGNNGGDGWVVAQSLMRRGFASSVVSTGDPRTEESRAARSEAINAGVRCADSIEGAFIVDALLGTGSTGAPRGAVAESSSTIEAKRAHGAAVVSLDLPSGLDASDGHYSDVVHSDMTVSFGVMKRGHLMARDVCGSIAVVDIGLPDGDAMSCLPLLIDSEWVRARVPRIPPSSHKGTRKSLSVIGGGPGMAGAAILSGEGALRSGIGLLRIVTAPGNEIAIHAGIPAAIVFTWPVRADDLAAIAEKSDAIAIGPGLGNSAETRDLVERVLLAWSGPVVLDADALNVFAGDVLSLSQLIRGRPAVITPHPAEFARLVGVDVREVLDSRFDIGLDLAAQLGAAVLLKGSPTVIFSPSGERFVSASGTAALATGGSGDILTGMIGTLLAQMCTGDAPSTAAHAAGCAAFVHGRSAELCGVVRGTTLADVLASMPAAWNETPRASKPGVLGELGNFS